MILTAISRFCALLSAPHNGKRGDTKLRRLTLYLPLRSGVIAGARRARQRRVLT